MEIRQASLTDAPAMSLVLQQITAAGKRTRPSDLEFTRATYLEDPDRIATHVAVDAGGTILGLQSLKRAAPRNPYGVHPGWGIIGTHVSPAAARRGCGKALFAATLEAARQAGLRNIDASIEAGNTEGLAYYDSIGFRTYRTAEGYICKRYQLR